MMNKNYFSFISKFLMISIMFCGLCFDCYGNAKAEEILKVGYFVLAPYVFEKDGNSRPSGAAAEYFEAVAQKMQVDIEWSELPFSRLLKYLDSGEIDADLLLVRDSEREKKYLFPQNAFALSQSGLAVMKTCPLERISSADDLKSLKIGFFEKAYLSPFMRNKEIQFEFRTGNENVFHSLLIKLNAGGRIDAVYSPTMLTLEYESKKAKLEDRLKFIAIPEPPVEFCTAFSKNALKFYQNYNLVHNELISKNVFQVFLKKYVD